MAPSRASQPPLALELHKRTRLWRLWVVRQFFPLLLSLVWLLLRALDLQHREEGLRQHTERDVPIPALPRAHLILVEADLVFAHLKTLLDCPACTDDEHHLLQGGSGGSKHQHIGQLGWLDSHGHAAPDDQPVLPAGRR